MASLGLHYNTTRILLFSLADDAHISSAPTSRADSLSTYLLVKHFALRTQSIALLHQTVDLLPPLQHTLNRLVQHNFCFVQLFLNLHNAVGLLRVLVFHNVFFELREVEFGR